MSGSFCRYSTLKIRKRYPNAILPRKFRIKLITIVYQRHHGIHIFLLFKAISEPERTKKITVILLRRCSERQSKRSPSEGFCLPDKLRYWHRNTWQVLCWCKNSLETRCPRRIFTYSRLVIHPTYKLY